MKTVAIGTGVFAVALVGGCWQLIVSDRLIGGVKAKEDAPAAAVERGAKWLVSTQGKDGGWGQDGGETSYVRQGERLETSGNDIANTAAASLALLHAANVTGNGEYRTAVERGVRFILREMERAPKEGLAISSVTGTQIQRKLGPYIDTFLTSMLFSELDGTIKDPHLNTGIRGGLETCIAKIQKNQLKDGSWNLAGGWAPVLGTSMASRSLFNAQQKGVPVDTRVMARADDYAKVMVSSSGGGTGSGSGRGVGAGLAGGRVGDVPKSAAMTVRVEAESAGVPLYQSAQVLEQLSRTESDRTKNAKEIRAVTSQLSNDRFVSGFGSMGGEEFFSYLNISDSLHRSGGDPWHQWNNRMKTQLVKLQNQDGTWAGHHCITGRVAVTSAALLTLLVERNAAEKPTVLPSKVSSR